MTDWVFIVMTAIALYGWGRYHAERERSRDYATDLSQLIYDYDLTEDDLRRSLNHDEIKERVER